MTTPRDPDPLIRAFLEEGPTVMTDRVLDAIRDDVDATKQRAGFGPWRTIPMIRPILATAAVVAAIAAGLAVYSVVSPNVGFTPVEPTSVPTPTPQSFPAARGPLIVGTTYSVDYFGEQLQLTIPDSMNDSEVVGDGNIETFRVDALLFGVATFHDDIDVADDLCQETDTIPLPNTTDEITAWLNASPGMTVSQPTEFTTADGRTVLAFDVTLGDSCAIGSEPLVSGTAFWFQRGEHHRVYAIPTVDDTILGVTWGGGFAGEGEEFLPTMNAATDDLVHSMKFE